MEAEVERGQVPQFINHYFTQIGPKLAGKSRGRWKYFGKENEGSLMDLETDYNEVLKLCKEINVMKSSGLDKLSSRICKDAFLVLIDKLVHIFACSFETNIFPTEWKSAKVVPLYKGGEPDDVSNYRPVSLLPLPGKLLEKIVHKSVSNFFNDSNFLSEHQGGFRKGFSTLSTVADLTDYLFEQINLGMTTPATFIDLSKAFDTVNTEILLKKRKYAGIRNNPLKWCTNYLSQRRQCTVANGITSPFLPVTCGVPQGSVLGPLFFLIYVNDLQYALDDCNLKLYADDTVLYQSGHNCGVVEQKLQASLNKFHEWSTANALTINGKKTKLMAFGSRAKVKKCNKATVVLNGERIKLVPSFKYLGVTLDPTLNYNQHISLTIRCVQHKLSMLGKIKKYLKREVALNIYKSMVPYLDYGDVIYSKAGSNDLDKLQRQVS